jgi:hypothetical protein
MKPSMLVWLSICGGLAIALSLSGLLGWIIGSVVVGALVLAIPLTVKRIRQERNLARAVWSTLTTR